MIISSDSNIGVAWSISRAENALTRLERVIRILARDQLSRLTLVAVKPLLGSC